ncbi:MAG: hypothetical protein P4L53_27035 [Candidatus Obscuribacterales bacterium]|nr:hypothetical protein [Candidatus Obscuribacterales bacterium]
MNYSDILKYVQAGDPNCSPEMLEDLARDKVDRIRLRVAENPGTPIEVLELLAADKNVDVRIAVGTNSSTPPNVRRNLAFDHDLNVRLGLAEDLQTPLELLNMLCHDTNPYVSCRAEQTKALVISPSAPINIDCLRIWRWATKDAERPGLRCA